MSKFLKYVTTLLAITGLVALAACSDNVKEPLTPKYNTKLSADEIRSSAFAEAFPLQYRTFLKNNQTGVEFMTDFGGPVRWRKNDNVNR